MSVNKGFIYSLCLALWVGGMAIYTFLVTPAIFSSFDRDTASRVVDALFSGYFYYVLALSAGALAVFLVGGWKKDKAVRRMPLALLAAAVVLNLYMSFVLYPQIKKVKATVSSFVTEPEDSAARKRFKKLHAISSVINLLVLADGAALIYLSSMRED